MLVYGDKYHVSTPMMLDKSNSLAMIPIEHFKVHDQKSITVNYLEKAVANSGFARLLIKCGNAQAHITIQLEAEGKVYFRTYSEFELTDDGTGASQLLDSKLTEFNRYSGSDYEYKTMAFYNPTFTGGKLRGNRMLPFGQGGTASGGSAGSRIESVFQPNQNYIIELQNVSGQARDLGIVLDWYEVVI